MKLNNLLSVIVGVVVGLMLGIGAYHILKPRVVESKPITVIEYEYIDTCTVTIDSMEIYKIIKEGIRKTYRPKPKKTFVSTDTDFKDSLELYLDRQPIDIPVEESKAFVFDTPDELKPALQGITTVWVQGNEVKEFVQDFKFDEAVLEKRYEKVIKVPSPPRTMTKEVIQEVPKLRNALLFGGGVSYFGDGISNSVRTNLDQFQYNVGLGWKDKKDRIYLGSYSPNVNEVRLELYMPLFRLR